ncbi:MAG: DEAD/DEAH box helicase [Pirellulales bacterium]|nr:DEAD/DEAH box helicase [Pirellulales bacterium]
MSLVKRCQRQFSQGDWQKGLSYERTNRVSILDASGDRLYADVVGTRPQPYEVLLDWSGARQGVLAVDCSCPRFAEVGVCKHVAAAIIAADQQGYGGQALGSGQLYLEALDDFASTREVDADVADYIAIAKQMAQVADSSGMSLDQVRRLAAARGGEFSGGRSRKQSRRRRPRQRAPDWQQKLAGIRGAQMHQVSERLNAREGTAKSAQLWYVMSLGATREHGVPCISIYQRKIKKNGALGKLTFAKLDRDEIDLLADPQERRLVSMLAGNQVRETYGSSFGNYGTRSDFTDVFLRPALFDSVLPALCASGRFGWLENDGANREQEVHLLAWDDSPPYRFELEVSRSADGQAWQFVGGLRRGDEVVALQTPLLLLAHGLVIFADRIALLDCKAEFSWIAALRAGPLTVPVKDEALLVEHLATLPEPPSELPSELNWQERTVAPVPCLRIVKPKEKWKWQLECHLSFRYGDQVARPDSPLAWFDRASRSVVRRDLEAEAAALAQLGRVGVEDGERYGYDADCLLAPASLNKAVLELSRAGWHVEAEGRTVRRPGSFEISVTSGVDWFDLVADCDFGGVKASLPQLLAAVEAGQHYVQLGDGSQGMLPDQWLKRFAPLVALGKPHEQALRFVPSQGALLDALLAAQPHDQVRVDRQFAALRERLRQFEGIQPREAPPSFVGQLRPYQRAGLGWLHFLDEFGFGGCLADDMGLGKTVQILAWLEQRRRQRLDKRGRKRQSSEPTTSIVVVPRSLVFNWLEEARRFTPELRVLDYTGLERRGALELFADHDLVVTTYGTLRRDIAKLRELEFDVAILDEAQAIKNAGSQAAKASRLLPARRRLAVTGTPVENHLGELWSLFEFLNPGMLGRHERLNNLLAAGRNGKRAANSDDTREDVALLARALRPFLLRRTKQQVLTDLPPKSEQTLYCELENDQRVKYDELREHYRRTLLARVSDVGVNKAKIHVLEALLRLRQAACHPGLLDKKLAKSSSAKLETLLDQLDEVLAEGHKALVFSQFTSLLAIVREHLDGRGIVYEYLDGRTVKRQAKVERFQTDPACPLFLISLKAGGQGLNLTAADYVFILDPWWNPAVEAQAVDRAHRIGQQRHVFAYRLIARDTVEEKILQLQDQKRDLAEAIITADNSLLRNLTTEDLQVLLS